MVTDGARLGFSPPVLHASPPYACIRCNKPFGTLKAIESMLGKLAGHAMFQGEALQRLKMCGDCRVVAQTRHSLDPYAGPARPPTRTTDDYR